MLKLIMGLALALLFSRIPTRWLADCVANSPAAHSSLLPPYHLAACSSHSSHAPGEAKQPASPTDLIMIIVLGLTQLLLLQMNS
jgi:hypothetical protein